MRSAFSPLTVGSTTISNSAVITSVPTSIAPLAMPPSACGTMLPKLRLQPNYSAADFCPSRVRYWQPDNALQRVATITERNGTTKVVKKPDCAIEDFELALAPILPIENV